MVRRLTGGRRFPDAPLADVSTRQDLSARGVSPQKAEAVQISLSVHFKPILIQASPSANSLSKN